VIGIAAKKEPVPGIGDFIGKKKVLIAGSTWPEDELVLRKAFDEKKFPALKLIIAPHEVGEKHIASLKEQFPGAILFSELSLKGLAEQTVLIIDNIGMLSRLYQYADITYVGGGLRTQGVHNVLEAAVYGKPVLFGPRYHKYSEAVGLVLSGGGIGFTDEKRDGQMLSSLINALLDNRDEYDNRSRAAGEYVLSHKGATQTIIQYIQEKRLLTN
jgi:3-deoxy-D-manno-octulosonic-acid transferase